MSDKLRVFAHAEWGEIVVEMKNPIKDNDISPDVRQAIESFFAQLFHHDPIIDTTVVVVKILRDGLFGTQVLTWTSKAYLRSEYINDPTGKAAQDAADATAVLRGELLRHGHLGTPAII